MTEEIHITFQAGGEDGRIIECDVEVTAVPDGKAWDFKGFAFEEIVATKGGESESLDFMPEEIVSQAEDIAESEFLKLDL